MWAVITVLVARLFLNDLGVSLVFRDTDDILSWSRLNKWISIFPNMEQLLSVNDCLT